MPIEGTSLRRKPAVRARKRSFSLARQKLLMLHLDAAKLRQQQMHLGDMATIVAVLAARFGSPPTLADATTLAELRDFVAAFERNRKTCDVVVVVAHSNDEVIRVAGDCPPVEWIVFSKLIKPINPRRLLLVACKAGKSGAANALFKSNQSLTGIYASPVNATKDFGALMLAAVPYLVSTRRPAAKKVQLGQVLGIGLAGRQLREWKRITYKDNPDNFLLDLASDPGPRRSKRSRHLERAFRKRTR